MSDNEECGEETKFEDVARAYMNIKSRKDGANGFDNGAVDSRMLSMLPKTDIKAEQPEQDVQMSSETREKERERHRDRGEDREERKRRKRDKSRSPERSRSRERRKRSYVVVQLRFIITIINIF